MLGVIYIVCQVLEAPVRFGDILRLAQTSPTTVSKRLKEAVAAGLFTRQLHDENPPRVEYAPTPRLMELEPIFYRLNLWCRKHELGTYAEPTDVKEEASAPASALQDAHGPGTPRGAGRVE